MSKECDPPDRARRRCEWHNKAGRSLSGHPAEREIVEAARDKHETVEAVRDEHTEGQCPSAWEQARARIWNTGRSLQRLDARLP